MVLYKVAFPVFYLWKAFVLPVTLLLHFTLIQSSY
uniref:Uncharacterized protein n=1 Tax=Rhizophora mucronata TaxID=61149 RepID=A0A2P2NMI3_RHIMU